MTAKTRSLKNSIQTLCDAGVRKTTFYPLVAKSLASTAGQARQLRRTKAFAYLLDNVEQVVLPHELLGGSIIGMWPQAAEIPYEEHLSSAYKAVDNALNQNLSQKQSGPRFALMARDHYDANICYKDMQSIIKKLKKHYKGDKRVKPYMIGKILEKHFVFDYGSDVMDLINGLPWVSANHTHLNYGMIINTGYGALLDKTNMLLRDAKLKNDPEKIEFYTAVKISLEAVIRYIKRYSMEYSKAAVAEKDPERAAELDDIAKILEKVSLEKAGSFREAMQLVWITHIIASVNMGSALSFARFDQYMYPFYKVDKEKNKITREEARELIAHMILKINEPKMRTVQSMALGGTTTDGENAANDLTGIILEAAREVRMPYPNISLRVASGLTPEWVYDEAIETLKLGFGMPMILNDNVWIKNFMSLGYPAEYARDYYNMGCVEMMIQNRQAHWLGVTGGSITFPVILENILTDYTEGKLKLEKFNDLMGEMINRINIKMKSIGGDRARKYIDSMHEHLYDPFGSALIYNCLDKGRDMYHRGPELAAQIAVSGSGLATAADSLGAIKTIVFDQKEINLRDLIKAVNSNFENNETLRLKLRNNVIHYGNDDDTADGIAKKLFQVATEAVHALNDGAIEDKFVNSYFGYTAHVSMGETMGATPDGRKAGVPLSDGVGPVQGKDSGGPTKLISSLMKLDYKYLTGANATNCRISPSLLDTPLGVKAFKTLLKTFIAGGGPQLQINFVRQEDLLEAQTDPDKHRDIIVRIAGFCEYFVNLDHNQQNEIISRTAHEF